MLNSVLYIYILQSGWKLDLCLWRVYNTWLLETGGFNSHSSPKGHFIPQWYNSVSQQSRCIVVASPRKGERQWGVEETTWEGAEGW